MNDDLLERAKRQARRITRRETIEGNMEMFRQLGLDEDDVESMAKEVGLELDDLLLQHPSWSELRHSPPSAPGRPGRKNETHDIAVFANERRPTMTWDEIHRQWIRVRQDDKRFMTKERIREAHRRHFGNKAHLRTSREKKP